MNSLKLGQVRAKLYLVELVNTVSVSGDVRGQEDRVRDLGCEDQRGLQHPEEHQEAGGGERHEGEHQELVTRGTGQGRQQETCEDELHTQVT